MSMGQNLLRNTFHGLISYEPLTGCVVWCRRPLRYFSCMKSCVEWNARNAGETFAYKDWDADGRLCWYFDYMNMKFPVHQVVWALRSNRLVWDVSHRNGDGTDNRWKNLRGVSPVTLTVPKVSPPQTPVKRAVSGPEPAELRRLFRMALTAEDVGPKTGIYFLCDETDIAYIGKSKSVSTRVNGRQQLVSLTKMISVADPTSLAELERDMISLLQPRANTKLKSR